MLLAKKIIWNQEFSKRHVEASDGVRFEKRAHAVSIRIRRRSL